jgi:hypothetical protein
MYHRFVWALVILSVCLASALTGDEDDITAGTEETVECRDYAILQQQVDTAADEDEIAELKSRIRELQERRYSKLWGKPLPALYTPK